MPNNPILRPDMFGAGDEVDVKQKSLFARLKKLFAAGVVVRNVGGKKLKVKDTSDLMYATDRNSLRDRFNRVRSTSYNAYTRDFSLAYQAARIDLFRDYDTMDMDPIIASALDIYADECLTINEMGKVLVVHAEDDNIKGILTNLFYDVLNIEHNLWSWTRNMCKYGDFYMRLYISPEYGVYQIEPISAYNVERLENTDPLNKNYVKFQIRPTDTSQVETLESFECAHFRLLSDSNFLPYGKCLAKNSYIETEFGAKRITELEIGERVWTFNTETKLFELSDIVNKCNSGIKEIVKISTQHNQLECSKNHPILTYSDDKFEYKLAENICLKDLIVLSSNKQIQTKTINLSKEFITTDNHNGWKTDTSFLPDEIDGHFSQFLGFMFGDGWLNKDLNRVSFAAGIDPKINETYTYYLYKYSHKDVKKIPAETYSGEQRYVDSKLLAEFLYINGFRGGSEEKRIPHWVYEMPEYCQLCFIKGLVDSDGSIFKDKWNVNRYSIELHNKELVEDIKALLSRLNIKSSHVKERGFDGETEICGKKCNRTKSYYIYFYLDAPRKKQLQKYDLLKNDNLILEPVRKIELNGEQETYDIQVSSNNSNFIANGIIVHNSMIEGGRRVWKQLSLLEDAMLINRIMRAPERRIFKIDVGNIPPQEVDAFMEKMMAKVQKVPYVDQQTGDYNLRFNLMNMVQDFYLPVRGTDSGTQIETLSGIEWTGIDDIEYVRNKMMAALKIPKAFLGYEEELSGKATLASEDVRFARTIQRIQRIIISELEKIAIVHLYSQGYRDESLVNFKIELTNPSTIFEKEKIEVWSNKVEVASRMMEIKLFPKSWVYKNVFNLSEDDVEGLQDDIVKDSKQLYRFRSIEEEGNDPAQPFKKINPGAPGEAGHAGGLGPESPLGGLGGPELGGSPLGGTGGPGGLPGGPGGGPLEEGTEDTGSLVYETPIKPAPIKTGGMEESLPPNMPDPQSIDANQVAEEHGVHSDEYNRNRDQTGQKNARRDYPFGEDPLGNIENNSKPRPGRAITHKFAKGSPLALEDKNVRKKRVDTMKRGNIIKSLDAYLTKNQGNEKKGLIKEASGTKSIMDPSVLIDE